MAKCLQHPLQSAMAAALTAPVPCMQIYTKGSKVTAAGPECLQDVSSGQLALDIS